jgi:manganese/zinc/iron transport system substrate-binding protein
MLMIAAFIPVGHGAQQIKVVTTIGQITDVVKNIGGEYIKVEGLMGPGVDPHLYRASESDVRKLSETDIIFYNGLFLEAKMEHVFEKMARTTKTVAVGEAVPKDLRLESIAYENHFDPHIWFDVTLWEKVCEQIVTTLSEFDPEHADVYQDNAQQYLHKLDDLHRYVNNRANELRKDERILVTAHDAFHYFGRAYDFEVFGLQGISTESQAGTKDVMDLADMIAERKIKAIFVESSVPERNIRAVQDAVRSRGWKVKIGGELFSDAMGDAGTFKGTYIGMVTHNIDTIVDALKSNNGDE